MISVPEKTKLGSGEGETGFIEWPGKDSQKETRAWSEEALWIFRGGMVHIDRWSEWSEQGG